VVDQAPGVETERASVVGKCPECGGIQLSQYNVLAEGGWFKVVKCQSCLHSLERNRLDPLMLVGRRSAF
jgi:hypothetical protein